MKDNKHRRLSASNLLTLLAVFGLTAIIASAGIANASAFSSAKETPLIQYDDDDMVPPMPDTPQAPEPGDIDDPALSPDSVITEPDPPIDQTEPYIIDPEPEVVDEPVINQDVNVVNEPEPATARPLRTSPGPPSMSPKPL